MYERHEYFLCTGAVHLVADDAFNCAQRTKPWMQKSVDAGCMATDVTGALKQIVADGIGIARRFAKALAEQSGKARIAGSGLSGSGSGAPETDRRSRDDRECPQTQRHSRDGSGSASEQRNECARALTPQPGTPPTGSRRVGLVVEQGNHSHLHARK
jgi:hypothetical protein